MKNKKVKVTENTLSSPQPQIDRLSDYVIEVEKVASPIVRDEQEILDTFVKYGFFFLYEKTSWKLGL